jgi:5-formyltetrahydrofolate cyclo-ligase
VPDTVGGTDVLEHNLDNRHDLDAAKRALRARIRARRRARPPAELVEDGDALAAVLLEMPEVRLARRVALYASTPGEPDTTALRAALRSLRTTILLPVIQPAGVLDWAEDDGLLVPGTGPGGPEPVGPRLGREGIREADVVLVPALAVDTLGRRLGQGAGYYDRALSLVDPRIPVIALVHEGEVLDAAVEPVPADVHDVGVDAVVTPVRCLRLPPRHL